MKRILFLLHTLDINPSANGICVKSIINEINSIAKNKIKIVCIACSEKGAKDYEHNDFYDVYRVKRTPISYLIRNPGNIILSKITMFIYRIEKMLLYPFWPIEYPLLINRILKKAISLHKEIEFDLVVSVYKNIENVYAAQKLKKKYPNIKHTVYFLDPLSCGFCSRMYSNNLINRRKFNLEKDIIQSADSIIYIRSNWNIIKNYYKEYPDITSKVFISDIPLFKPINFISSVKDKAQNRPIRIIYTGSLPKGIRNPIPFLKILSTVEDNIELIFAGSCDYDADILEYATEKHSIILLGKVSAKEVKKLQSDSDILLNIGNDYATSMLPSKIFEYMSTGKPIISTYNHKDDPSLQYLKKYSNSLLINTTCFLDYNTNALSDFLSSDLHMVDSNKLIQDFTENNPIHTASYLMTMCHTQQNNILI